MATVEVDIASEDADAKTESICATGRRGSLNSLIALGVSQYWTYSEREMERITIDRYMSQWVHTQFPRRFHSQSFVLDDRGISPEHTCGGSVEIHYRGHSVDL
ncbi:hypothetical protein Tco_1067790 [Tanacetum coccineum]|uniref:Uncharacterized protein n=1 Tax=Tanacetum coccineum TaxID=301880 RepID=A0ABQ5HDW5_9ASTR